VASNDPDWVACVATRVLFLDAGRVVAEGSVEELVGEVAPYQEARVELAGVAAVRAPELPGLRSFEQDGRRITAVLDRDPAMVAQLIDAIVSQGAEMRSIQVRRAGLRDAFLMKTGRTLDE
jgi:ABC-type multidrug transport system ATPase subunit